MSRYVFGLYTLGALLAISPLLAVAASIDTPTKPVEVVCDHPTFEPHPTAYAATVATCNDGIRVVILD